MLPLGEGGGPLAWSSSEPELAYALGFHRTLYKTTDAGGTWQPVS